MKVLIIGCGYIGLALGAELVRHGHQVTGVRRTRSDEADLTNAGLIPAMADITRPESLRALGTGYDWIANCVSASGGGVPEYEKVYLEGTRHLLSWLSASPPQKLVYTSSTSVYGQVDGSEVDERSPTSTLSGTGRVLVQTEDELLAASKAVPAVVLRVAGIYGPGRSYWLRQVRDRSACLDGTGERILNMIHRDDVVGAICVALERGQPGQVYNAVDNEPVSQRVFLEWLCARLHAPMPEAAAVTAALMKKRGLTSKRVSNRKLKEELAFGLKFPTFREGYARLMETDMRPVSG